MIANGDVQQLKKVKPILQANMQSHEELTKRLGEAVSVNEDEKGLINADLEKCVNLNMDANEMLNLVKSTLEESAEMESRLVQNTKVMEEEKLKREIDSLKLDADLKRAQIDKIKKDTDRKSCQNIKLPKIPLPILSGNYTEWTSFWDSYN